MIISDYKVHFNHNLKDNICNYEITCKDALKWVKKH